MINFFCHPAKNSDSPNFVLLVEKIRQSNYGDECHVKSWFLG